MNKRYYFKSFIEGLFIASAIAYSFWFSDNGIKQIAITVSIISLVLFPFSKLIIERFALKYTDRNFWNRGFFVDTPGKMGGLVLYDIFCFITSIPVFFAFTIVRLFFPRATK